MEYYSAIKRKEVLIYTTTWLNPENIMLKERSQTQKATYTVQLHLHGSPELHIHTHRKQINGLPAAGGKGNRE